MTTYNSHMTDADFCRIITRPSFAHGTAREVYNVACDNSVVAKRVCSVYPGSNMVEWFIWNAVKSTSLAEIFGECFCISHTGQYILMERLDDLRQTDYADVPLVPDWLNDRKPSAFGKLGTTIKVRDYGVVDFTKLLQGSLTVAVPFQVNALSNRRQGFVGW